MKSFFLFSLVFLFLIVYVLIYVLFSWKIYENHDVEIQEIEKKVWSGKRDGEDVCVYIGIYSGYRGRRDALRQTFLQNAIDGGLCVKYKFIETPGWEDEEKRTNRQKHYRQSKEEIEKEADIYGDLLIIEGDDGFGKDMTRRYLNFLSHANNDDSVDYVVLMDDDIYLCLRRMMNELKNRPRTKLIVGSFFCRSSENTVPDERVLILSRDIVQTIVNVDSNLGLNVDCAFGQSLVLWVGGSNVEFFHDERIVQQQRSVDNKKKYHHACSKCDDEESYKNLECEMLAVHHANETQVLEMWQYDREHLKEQTMTDSSPPSFTNLKEICEFHPGITYTSCHKVGKQGKVSWGQKTTQ